MQIHGIIVTRNDWAILALSISNVLIHHADIVHVLNHGSTDQTASGLKILQEIWGERLKVYTASAETPFNQSLLTNMMVSIVEDSAADWIYIFDSDEFLLSKENFSLREELVKLSDDTVAIKYSLSNFIATYDFDPNNLNCYNKLIYRSVPGVNYDAAIAKKLIHNGKLTFFDVPFLSKMIFRANSNLLISDGAHKFRYKLSNQVVKSLEQADCAHLTLYSKSNLERKSIQGKSHIDRGLPAYHGWQNQLVHQLDMEGKLDWFWERLSIKTEQNHVSNPKHTIDESLVDCLQASINLLKNKFGGMILSEVSGSPLKIGAGEETSLRFDDTFNLCDFFDQKINLLIKSMKAN